jgi:polar amino acid transport system substrate-binding protein
MEKNIVSNKENPARMTAEKERVSTRLITEEEEVKPKHRNIRRRRAATAIIAFLLFLLLLPVSGVIPAVPAISAVQTAAADEKTPPPGVYDTLDALADKTIGIETGSSFDELVSKRLPNAKKEYYNSKVDLVNALIGNKIDAFVADEPVIKSTMKAREEITYVPEYLDSFAFGLVFPKNEKGEELRNEFNEFLMQFKADGRMEALEAEWFGDDESDRQIPEVPAGEKGTLKMATAAQYDPFQYVRDGQVVGYDIDMVAQFCIQNGYGLEIADMNFDGVLPSVQTGKCDFAASGITITPERAESVLFSDPNFSGGTVAAVLRKESTDGKKGFWAGIAESFNKTFIRENRWQLFVNGLVVTLIITTLSILLGTILGFVVFMLCRRGNPIALGATRFCSSLVQGMPMVVLLMILYYIVFGKVAISGMMVSVIGFTLTFGSSVYSLLKMGVGAVDNGQYEAAFALGYSDRKTFFRIILPQGLPHVISAYKGEIVGLIKATAIVGYIAVTDLTKMGDIVRSRTYDAFFPLIAMTIIYFALEAFFIFLVNRIAARFDPKRRSPQQVLKGVEIHDPN